MKEVLDKLEACHYSAIPILDDNGVYFETLNRSERSIKPFVIGRKNWLFANTPREATSSAVICSVIETAKENGLHPFEYLKYLFEQLPQLRRVWVD